jgi:8-oxo-dGTP diphosphatase
MAPLAWIPRSVLAIGREFGRHLLRRPVVGVAAAAHTSDGQWLLVRRADTGTWCLPGGTLEWGETVRDCLVREVAEETGARVLTIGQIVGVYSSPDRDPRFHAVTVVVRVVVDAGRLRPDNPLEIREARLFALGEIPYPLAFHTDDIMRRAVDPPQEPELE